MFPTRLSFLRSLTRRLAQEKVTIDRPVWEMDAEGFSKVNHIRILDIMGREWANVLIKDPTQKIDLGQFMPAGLYFLNIYNKEGQMLGAKRILKK